MAESEWNVCRLSRSKHEIKKRLYGADTASHGHMRNPVREKIIFRQNHLPLKEFPIFISCRSKDGEILLSSPLNTKTES